MKRSAFFVPVLLFSVALGFAEPTDAASSTPAAPAATASPAPAAPMAEEKRLMKGNEAIGEAALRAGVRAYFGYPITPQSELTAYMAQGMIDRKRTFIQAESETSAINMVYGAAATGARAMTSSSSPGISLKQEGISYACGADMFSPG